MTNKKIRYSKQRRLFDCSCVAIINACKFYGAKISYRKEYQSLCDILGVERDCGVPAFEIKELIELSDFPYKIKEIKFNPKLSDLKRYLATNNAIMFIYNEHISLIIDYKDNTYSLLNHFSNVTLSKLDSKEVRKLLKSNTSAYFLERKNEI